MNPPLYTFHQLLFLLTGMVPIRPFFCKRCGTPLAIVPKGVGMVTVPCPVFPDFPFEPQYHLNCGSNELARKYASATNDGLPKYLDFPVPVRPKLLPLTHT